MKGKVVEDGGCYHPFQLYFQVIKSLYLVATWLEIKSEYLCTRQTALLFASISLVVRAC